MKEICQRQLYKVNEVYTFTDYIKVIEENYALQTAFIWYENNVRCFMNYAEFCLKVKQVGIYLSNINCKSIAIIGENSIDWVIAYFAVQLTGRTVIPLDRELTINDLSAAMYLCDCDVLIYTPMYKDKAESLVNEGAVKVSICSDLFAIIDYCPDNILIDRFDPNRTAVIMFTSGTTGKSKAVMLSEYGLLLNVMSCRCLFNFVGNTLAILPLYHSYAMYGSVLVSLFSGVAITMCPDIKEAFSLMVKEDPDYLFLVPTIINGMAAMLKRKVSCANHVLENVLLENESGFSDKNDIKDESYVGLVLKECVGSHLKFIISGGAQMKGEAPEILESVGIAIYNGYGITECSPAVSVNRNGENKKGSVGMPMPYVEVVTDTPDNTSEGELLVRGVTVMKGYYNDSVETDLAMKKSWFRTGDVGFIDNDGFIFITGRIKNLIILSNGKNVSPEELESKLLLIPGIAECLVFALHERIISEIIPDKGQLATLAVTDEQNYFSEELDKLNSLLPSYKRISEIHVVSELPKTALGKLVRYQNGDDYLCMRK